MPLLQSYLQEHNTREKLLPLGRDLYRQKQYDDALQVFNAALALPQPQEPRAGVLAQEELSVKLLDYRAATFAKLEQLDLALKDAKKMIEVQERRRRGEISGYLRTSRVLEELGKVDLALKILRRGMQRGRKEMEGFEMLQSVYSRLSRALTPPNLVDPLTMLPLELMEMVFQYVPFRTLCVCLRVSKHWRGLLQGYPGWWSVLDFSQSRNFPSWRAISSYMVLSRHGVREAVLRGGAITKGNMLPNILQKCKKLDTLKIIGGGSVDRSFSSSIPHAAESLTRIILTRTAGIAVDTLALIFKKCTNLEHFEGIITAPKSQHFDISPSRTGCPKLKILVIQVVLITSLEFELTSLAPIAENLQRLEIRGAIHQGRLYVRNGLMKYTRLQELVISKFFCEHMSDIPLTLHTIVLEDTGVFSAPLPTTLFLYNTTEQSRGIIKLRARENHGVSEGLLRKFLEVRCSSGYSRESHEVLTTLDVNLGHEEAALELILSNELLKHLSTLVLANCSTLKDGHAGLITAHMKELKHLTLNEASITGVGVKQIVEELSCDTITLDKCRQVDMDVVEWAQKSKGVKVKVLNPMVF